MLWNDSLLLQSYWPAVAKNVETWDCKLQYNIPEYTLTQLQDEIVHYETECALEKRWCGWGWLIQRGKFVVFVVSIWFVDAVPTGNFI